jgi:hypothetical protein
MKSYNEAERCGNANIRGLLTNTYVVRAFGKTTTPARATGPTSDPFVGQAKF